MLQDLDEDILIIDTELIIQILEKNKNEKLFMYLKFVFLLLFFFFPF